MNTPEFNKFLVDQARETDEYRAKLTAAIEAVKADVASMHANRHETQHNISVAIGEIRLDQATTEKHLASLVTSVTELVSALKGNTLGSIGLVAQVAENTRKIGDIETAQKEARGMSRLIGWGVGLIGVLGGIKALNQVNTP